MFGLSRILFPTDLSPTGRQAFLQAASLAARTGAEVHVLHVATDAGTAPEGVRFTPFDEALLREQLRIDLFTWHTHVGAGMTRKARFVQAEVPGVPPDAAILAYADRYDIDLIVMGTHGRRGLWHLLFGSVAEAVIHGAACPVLTVHEDEAEDVRLDHVLVPIDFSAHASAALVYAKRLALLYRGTVSLLFVAESHVVSVPYDTGLPALALLRADPEITAHAEAALRQLDAATEAADVPTDFYVRRGDAAHEIAAFARDHAADLIVMTRYGHTDVTAHGLSAVTEKVVRTSACPVLTLPVPVLTEASARPGAAKLPEAGPPQEPYTARFHHGPL